MDKKEEIEFYQKHLQDAYDNCILVFENFDNYSISKHVHETLGSLNNALKELKKLAAT